MTKLHTIEAIIAWSRELDPATLLSWYCLTPDLRAVCSSHHAPTIGDWLKALECQDPLPDPSPFIYAWISHEERDGKRCQVAGFRPYTLVDYVTDALVRQVQADIERELFGRGKL